MHTCNIILYFFLYLRMSKESLYQPISQQKYTMKFNYSCIFKLDCGFFFQVYKTKHHNSLYTSHSYTHWSRYLKNLGRHC